MHMLHMSTHMYVHVHQTLKVGMAVCKEFDDGVYWGTITSIDVGKDDAGEPYTYYHITHDDGDEEDLDYEECITVIRT